MVRFRSLLLAIVASAALLGSLPASAAEWKPFDAASFAAAKKEGKSILVDIFAAWCPTCRAQNPILVQLTREPKFKDLVVFKVDFDTQKDDVRALKAQVAKHADRLQGRNRNGPLGRRHQSRLDRRAGRERSIRRRQMPIGTLGLAFLAGALSVLSPCVLPLLPIVLGTAASEHRLGPVALAAGLALSFTAIGLFVATIGFAAGLDTGVFRTVSAILLIARGPRAPGAEIAGAIRARGRPGQQLGRRLPRRISRRRPWRPIRAWAPARRGMEPLRRPDARRRLGACRQGRESGQVALTMLAFGIGAALPLMLLGFLSREAMMRWRGRLMEAGKAARRCLACCWWPSGCWSPPVSTSASRPSWSMPRRPG